MSKKQKKHPIHLTSEAVLDIVTKANKPLGIDDVLSFMRLARKDKQSVEFFLHALVAEGTLLRSRGKWFVPKNRKLVVGVLAVQKNGSGFVIPKEASEAGDVYVSPYDMDDALDGDTVEVMVLPNHRGPSREGRVTKVIQRTELPVPAIALRKEGDNWIAAPQHSGYQALFVVDTSTLQDEVEQDNLLLVLPEEMIGTNLWKARAMQNLHDENSPAAQELLTKISNGIPMLFPPDVLREAEELEQEPAENDIRARKDLRHISFVTIDGADAKDFDDAVYVEKTAKGYCLYVAIADVSHYVHEGSALDREANKRGNSYYFPQSVEPMLPHKLSNGLCSLNPHVPRLAVVVEMGFTPEGKEVSAKFYQAVIESKGRLTYDTVYAAVVKNESTAQKELNPHFPMLQNAFELANILRHMRAERGNLDFGLPEAQFVFTEQGTIQDIIARVSNDAHKLIEEFMIAANESVSRYLTGYNEPMLYRTHEAPSMEKLEAFKLFIEQTQLITLPPALRGKPAKATPYRAKQGGKDTGRKSSKAAFGKKGADIQDGLAITARDFIGILEAARGTPQEYTVNRLLLRAMMQAKYSPENIGHFGLASTCYGHFTSPIRRYADLTLHRSLKRCLYKKDAVNSKKESDGKWDNDTVTAYLARVAEHINHTEREALVAEREVHKRLAALYLQGKVGEKFAGVISGVTDFGIFVELTSCLAEGMIRLAALDDDYYVYFPERQMLQGKRTGKAYSIGTALEVQLMEVNLGRVEVSLLPVAIAERMQGEGLSYEKSFKAKKTAHIAKPAKAPKTKNSRGAKTTALQKRKKSTGDTKNGQRQTKHKK